MGRVCERGRVLRGRKSASDERFAPGPGLAIDSQKGSQKEQGDDDHNHEEEDEEEL